MSRRASLFATAILGIALLAPLRSATAEGLPEGGLLHTPFGDALAGRLVADGFDRGRVEALLGDKRLAINGTTLSYAIVYREFPADYSKFLLEERLSRARAFIAANRELLAAATARSGVPGEVIAAILMIESDFGAYRKLHSVLNVFATLLWAAEPANFETVRAIVQKRLPDVTAEKVREKTKSKAKWGYEQLTYLLRIAEREKIDLPALEGSWAGAFGMSQFIPSSYWGYAVDGERRRPRRPVHDGRRRLLGGQLPQELRLERPASPRKNSGRWCAATTTASCTRRRCWARRRNSAQGAARTP